jgi:hypothetical protein
MHNRILRGGKLVWLALIAVRALHNARCVDRDGREDEKSDDRTRKHGGVADTRRRKENEDLAGWRAAMRTDGL